MHLRSRKPWGWCSIETYTPNCCIIHFSNEQKHPHQESWRPRLLPHAAKYYMFAMLHTKRSLREYILSPYRKTPPPGSNGRNSAHGCALQKILQESRTRYPYSIFFRTGKYIIPRRQGKPYSEEKHVAIIPLLGGDTSGSGDYITQTQNCGRPRL